MMGLRAAASLFFNVFFIFPILAQTSGQLSDFPYQPPQFIYLYEEVEALTGEREFVDMITKGDGPNGSVSNPDKIISFKSE